MEGDDDDTHVVDAFLRDDRFAGDFLGDLFEVAMLGESEAYEIHHLLRSHDVPEAVGGEYHELVLLTECFRAYLWPSDDRAVIGGATFATSAAAILFVGHVSKGAGDGERSVDAVSDDDPLLFVLIVVN